MTAAMNRDQAIALFVRLQERFAAAKDELNALDASIGDGDHGTTIARGMAAAAAAVQTADATTAAEVFAVAGDAFQRSSGGAGGLLFAQIFKSIGQAAVSDDVSLPEIGDGLTRAAAQISRLGRARPGDKTMVDALGPAVDALVTGGDLDAAAAAAEDGAEATRDMAATQGRARYVADGGRGHIDPGARSVALILQTMVTARQDHVAGTSQKANP